MPEPGRRIIIRQSGKTSAGIRGSNLARAPTLTLALPSTEVVDRFSARSILAAGCERYRSGRSWRPTFLPTGGDTFGGTSTAGECIPCRYVRSEDDA